MEFDFSDIKLCIFDLDGTLVNSHYEEIPYFFSQLSQQLKCPIDNDISHYPQRTFSSVINQVSPHEQQQLLFSAMDNIMYEFVFAHSWQALDMGTSLLKCVQKKQINYLVVTGNYVRASLMKAEKAGLELSEEKIYATTPDLDSKYHLIQQLMDKHQCLPHEVLSVGDSEYDERTAMNLGVRFIKVD